MASASFRDTFEVGEDTISALLIGGEWVTVKREAHAINPDADGWIACTLPDETKLFVRNEAVQGVLCNYGKSPF